MGCPNVQVCACPETGCPNHSKCCACVKKHRETDSMPFCMFPDNGGNKSYKNFYQKLKAMFDR